MNRSTTIWLITMIAMMLAFYYILPRTQPKAPPKPAGVMLQQAESQAGKAGTDEKKLKAAVGAYDKVIGAHKGTEQAAEAKLRTAIIYETKLNNHNKAVQTYQSVIKEFKNKHYAAATIATTRLDKLRLATDIKNRPHPLYRFMDFFVALTGRNQAFSYFFALVLVTLIFKLMVTPLTHAQFKSMREMQKIQPFVKELQEKYKGDQKKIGEETMALYKEHGVNPFSSCLPLLVQMPVLYMLYWMVRLYEYQFVQAHFLWIGSGLAHKYPGIVGGNLAEPDIPLLVLYTISMIVSQRMTVMDPSQAQQQKMMAYTMPVLFAFIFYSFPAAFMLYWLVFNIISTTQQFLIMKKPLPEKSAVAVKNGDEATEQPVKLVEELQKASAGRPSQSARRRRKKY